MSLVWYSNTYTKSMDSEDFFFTEYAVDSISAETLYKRGNEMWGDEWFRNQVSDKKKEWDERAFGIFLQLHCGTPPTPVSMTSQRRS